MSTQDLHSFGKKVSENTQWQKSLNASNNEQEFVKKYILLAKENGFTITEQELKAIRQKNKTTGKMSAKELDSVAGGSHNYTGTISCGGNYTWSAAC